MTADSEELKKVAEVKVRVSAAKSLRLSELLKGWAQHVQRLQTEASASIEADPNAWGGHDYLAALHLRDLIAQGVEESTPDVRGIVNTLIATSDEEFKAFTELDMDGVVERFSGELHKGTDWWWKRLPKSGPARQELLNL
jgi:hypothetical protein